MLTAARSFCDNADEKDCVKISAPAFIQYREPQESCGADVTGWSNDPDKGLTDEEVTDRFLADYIKKTRLVLKAYGNVLPFSFPHLMFYEFFNHMFRPFEFTFKKENIEKVATLDIPYDKFRGVIDEALKDIPNARKLMGCGENPFLYICKYRLYGKDSYLYTYNLTR